MGEPTAAADHGPTGADDLTVGESATSEPTFSERVDAMIENGVTPEELPIGEYHGYKFTQELYPDLGWVYTTEDEQRFPTLGEAIHHSRSNLPRAGEQPLTPRNEKDGENGGESDDEDGDEPEEPPT